MAYIGLQHENKGHQKVHKNATISGGEGHRKTHGILMGSSFSDLADVCICHGTISMAPNTSVEQTVRLSHL